MDMEKVIKGIEICRHGVISQENCKECPYIYDGRAKQSNCEGVLHLDALAILQEQEEQIDRLIEESASNAEMAEGLKELLKEQEELLHKKQKDIDRLCNEISEWKHKFHDIMLKEQEAVEPKKENDGNPEPWTAWWYACGACRQPIDKMDRYCRRCGKQVKWK